MPHLNRRAMIKIASVGTLAAGAGGARASAVVGTVRKWEIFEITLTGPQSGNPFRDVQLTATFSLGNRNLNVEGFYEDNGVYKVRFMPDAEGDWSFQVSSPTHALDGQSGRFTCVAAAPDVHGPVQVQHGFYFWHADGKPFQPFGTTCYAWIHQSETLQKETLATLVKAPFNKVRMCVFPKSYEYNHNEPAIYPFARSSAGESDFTRPNPAFYHHLESCVAALRGLHIQAEIILFPPDDRWGYATMAADNDDFYLRYVVARLSSYRNVWWSMANEWDFMKAKKESDFDRLFRILSAKDPSNHLRSIHNGKVMYDHSRPWISHASIQGDSFDKTGDFWNAYRKPVIFDEVQYEGNLNRRWGNLSGEEMTWRVWRGVIHGAYVTHGETLLTPHDAFDENATPDLWWAHGGALRGTSPKRIGFLRGIVEKLATAPGARNGLTRSDDQYYPNVVQYADDDKTAQAVLYFFDYKSPIWYEFPLPEGQFTAELIDPWSMTRTVQPGRFTGKSKLRLPGKPYQAMLFRRV